MKNFLAISLVLSCLFITPAHAIIAGGDQQCFYEGAPLKGVPCVLISTTSLPTIIIASDNMEKSELSELVKSEAQNYLDGVDGDYLLLKMTAKSMNKSVDEIVDELLK